MPLFPTLIPLHAFTGNHVNVFIPCVCVCVCEREREREIMFL